MTATASFEASEEEIADALAKIGAAVARKQAWTSALPLASRPSLGVPPMIHTSSSIGSISGIENPSSPPARVSHAAKQVAGMLSPVKAFKKGKHAWGRVRKTYVMVSITSTFQKRVSGINGVLYAIRQNRLVDAVSRLLGWLGQMVFVKPLHYLVYYLGYGLYLLYGTTLVQSLISAVSRGFQYVDAKTNGRLSSSILWVVTSCLPVRKSRIAKEEGKGKGLNRFRKSVRSDAFSAQMAHVEKAPQLAKWDFIHELDFFQKVQGSFKRFQAAFRGGPEGLPGQYGVVYSRVRYKTLNPVWKQYIEMRLEGGTVNEEGEFHNPDAPYTRLRIEVWDKDRLSADDFMGEVYVNLCPLMDGRTHTYELPLTDPEGKCGADSGLSGMLKFQLQYEG